jgi:hypothetical protein
MTTLLQEKLYLEYSFSSISLDFLGFFEFFGFFQLLGFYEFHGFLEFLGAIAL